MFMIRSNFYSRVEEKENVIERLIKDLESYNLLETLLRTLLMVKSNGLTTVVNE